MLLDFCHLRVTTVLQQDLQPSDALLALEQPAATNGQEGAEA